MITRAWMQEPPRLARVTFQRRSKSSAIKPSDIFWDPRHSYAPLLEWVRHKGTFDAMVVLAGVTPASGIDLSLNTAIAQACLAGAHAAGIPRVLLASSSAVYGFWKDDPFLESDNLQPVNAYGQAKLDMEAACAPYRKAELEICCLRIGNVAGADALLMQNIHRTRESPLRLDKFADGTGPIRSYIGPITMAKVLETLAVTPKALPEALNFATLNPVTMESLAQSAGYPWKFTAASGSAHQRITLDCSALHAIHECAPHVSHPDVMVDEWKKVRA